MDNNSFKKSLKSRQSTYCPDFIAEEIGSERLGYVPKDLLASRWQSQNLAPTLRFQVLCPFNYTTFIMPPYLNMILTYTSRQFFT